MFTAHITITPLHQCNVTSTVNGRHMAKLLVYNKPGTLYVGSKSVRRTWCACIATPVAAAKSSRRFASLRTSFPTLCTHRFYCQDRRPATPYDIINKQQHGTEPSAQYIMPVCGLKHHHHQQILYQHIHGFNL